MQRYEVSYGNRVYLTRNGYGQCVIIDMKELDELDRLKAMNKLMSKLEQAEMSIREEGTISAEELELGFAYEGDPVTALKSYEKNDSERELLAKLQEAEEAVMDDDGWLSLDALKAAMEK